MNKLFAGKNFDELQILIQDSRSRLSQCMKDAASWEPKLKEGMDLQHQYGECADGVHQWLNEVDQLLESKQSIDVRITALEVANKVKLF